MRNAYGHEALNREFKSDIKRLPDKDIVEAVVALANTDGGSLYLGVEDDGSPSGVCEEHKDTTGLVAYIANSTVPPVAVRAEIEICEDKQIVVIEVPRSLSVVSTSSGKIVRRRLKADGTPESVPMYPYELSTRLSDLGRLDLSAEPVLDATQADFDPQEVQRLHNIISTYKSSDNSLAEMQDEDLEKALGLVKVIDGSSVPTLTGLLLLGRESALRNFVPTHEVTFQVLSGTEVKVNETFHTPLLKAFVQINQLFEHWNPTTELIVGLFSELVPDFDKQAFREALVNALGHRDYSILGRVRVQIDDEGLTIANPGGFMEGIDLHHLLTAEPRGRNPCLMDAMKRIGLAERTGRGIDRIYEGALSYGRPSPDYSSSRENLVSLFIARSAPDRQFVAMLAEEQERTGRPLSVNALLVLNMLKNERRCSFNMMTQELDMNELRLKSTLRQLQEVGLIERTGSYYLLGAKVYKRTGRMKEYVRQTDIDRLRYPELIMKLARADGEITRKDVMALLRLNANQAYYQLSKLVDSGKLQKFKHGKGTHYRAVAK